MHRFTADERPSHLDPELWKPLWDIPKAPAQIFVQGSERALSLLPLLMSRGLAVVGTRRPRTRTVESLRHWIRELAGSDLIIVSGFARGIDAAAHEAAINAGLPTVAILGSSFDRLYPIDHEPLRQRILENDGLLITEYPFGTQTFASHFLDRNRLIAAWSKATWVVEAAARSGSLNTAHWAREIYDRPCLATPCFPGDESFAGNEGLLDQHAALPFWGTSSLGAAWLELSNWKEIQVARKNPRRKKAGLSPNAADEVVITQCITDRTTTEGGVPVQHVFDECLAKGWPPQRFFEALKKALQSRRVLDRNGLLLKSPTYSD